jgi:hypothetical protein
MAASNLQTKNHAFQPVFMAPVLPILYPDMVFSFFVILQKKIKNPPTPWPTFQGGTDTPHGCQIT